MNLIEASCICIQYCLHNFYGCDHLDIYGTSDAIEESFVEFANKIADKSRLFITTELPLEGSSSE
jgi:UDP-N-acetylmuramate-alanine ligase